MGYGNDTPKLPDFFVFLVFLRIFILEDHHYDKHSEYIENKYSYSTYRHYRMILVIGCICQFLDG